jgi:bacterioferritin-associated ferredoxin
MIVCSCNVLSDEQVLSTYANADRRLRMSQIYDRLGSSVQCGRCAHTIRRLMQQIEGRTIGSVIPRANTLVVDLGADPVFRSSLPVGWS